MNDTIGKVIQITAIICFSSVVLGIAAEIYANFGVKTFLFFAVISIVCKIISFFNKILQNHKINKYDGK